MCSIGLVSPGASLNRSPPWARRPRLWPAWPRSRSPPAAQTQRTAAPTYSVRTILSGQSLHHWYTKAGSKVRHSEALSSPDDITKMDGYLFTAFQNGVGPQGQASADGNRDSTVVEFTLSGRVVKQWDIRGKCDGLTANPRTGLLVATVNEDADSSLYTIRPSTGLVVHYSYAKPLPHHGGTDAISFDNGLMLISASAPGTTGAAAPNPAYPAAYVVTLSKPRHLAYFSPLFYERVARDRGERPALRPPGQARPDRPGLQRGGAVLRAPLRQ